MRRNPTLPAAARDVEIRRLRVRAQAAEAEARKVRAEADARIAAAQAEADAVEAYANAQIERIERAIAADDAYRQSPQCERDLLVFARDRVREELIELSLSHKNCKACGSFGRGFQQNFLQLKIDTLCETHGLEPAARLPDPDWPVQLGAVAKGGRMLNGGWMTGPAPKPRGTVRLGMLER